MMPDGFFPAVEPDAPVAPLLESLSPAVQAEIQRHADLPVTVHAELRAVRSPGGEVERERFYWSTQHQDPTAPHGFRARTLYAKGSVGEARLHEFPSEPALGWLGDDDGPLPADGRGQRVEVLRYIPLRRLTFRLHDGPGLPARVIGKAKRPGGLNRAATAFLAVEQAARRSRDAPGVPRLLRLEPPRHALYLEELPGEGLDAAIGGLDLVEAMEELGRLHRALQELDVRGLPGRRTTADWLADARRAAAGIGLFVPSVADRAEAVHAELARTAPEDGRALFCQGDFLPGQVLCHPSGWSVIDFDDSRYADPMSEVAALYAALPRTLRLPAASAELARRTYLEAYARRAGEPFDRDRWRWFLVLVQLVELGKRLMKGRCEPGEAARVLDCLSGPEVAGAD